MPHRCLGTPIYLLCSSLLVPSVSDNLNNYTIGLGLGCIKSILILVPFSQIVTIYKAYEIPWTDVALLAYNAMQCGIHLFTYPVTCNHLIRRRNIKLWVIIYIFVLATAYSLNLSCILRSVRWTQHSNNPLKPSTVLSDMCLDCTTKTIPQFHPKFNRRIPCTLSTKIR